MILFRENFPPPISASPLLMHNLPYSLRPDALPNVRFRRFFIFFIMSDLPSAAVIGPRSLINSVYYSLVQKDSLGFVCVYIMGHFFACVTVFTIWESKLTIVIRRHFPCIFLQPKKGGRRKKEFFHGMPTTTTTTSSHVHTPGKAFFILTRSSIYFEKR